jgi:hypothetical protein
VKREDAPSDPNVVGPKRGGLHHNIGSMAIICPIRSHVTGGTCVSPDKKYLLGPSLLSIQDTPSQTPDSLTRHIARIQGKTKRLRCTSLYHLLELSCCTLAIMKFKKTSYPFHISSKQLGSSKFQVYPTCCEVKKCWWNLIRPVHDNTV